MSKFPRMTSLALLTVLLLPILALAVVEPKSGVEYPDDLVLDKGDSIINLKATGVGLREKTILKVDIYTIVSYIEAGSVIEGDAAQAVLNLNAPKRLQLDLRRSFSREKLVNAFREVIEKNYDDVSAFQDDMNTFFAYFTQDAQKKDIIIFDWHPDVGLTTSLNGEELGIIDNFEFSKAMWTVWFGAKPSNKDLRKALIAEL